METLITVENAPYLWLALGAVLLAIEAFGIPGVGFLFAGLGAITTAILAHLGHYEPLAQGAWFFATTVAWTVLLWGPLKKLRIGKQGASDYSNMVGGTATVIDAPLSKGKAGKVTWSGTTMQAELAADATTDTLPEGTDVTIREVKGTTLIVELKT